MGEVGDAGGGVGDAEKEFDGAVAEHERARGNLDEGQENDAMTRLGKYSA